MVNCHDAWWSPTPAAKELPIDQDVMTVHHPAYYQGRTDAEPSDMDNPVPIPFATVKGSYLVVLEGPHLWCEAAMEILRIGLEQTGLGAKTAAGYGRAKLDFMTAEGARARADAELRERIREKIGEIVKNLGRADELVPEFLDGTPREDRRRVAKLLVEAITPKKLRDKKRREKPWAIRLLEEAGESAPIRAEDGASEELFERIDRAGADKRLLEALATEATDGNDWPRRALERLKEKLDARFPKGRKAGPSLKMRIKMLRALLRRLT